MRGMKGWMWVVAMSMVALVAAASETRSSGAPSADPSRADGRLSARQARTSDVVIARDLARFQSVLARLDALAEPQRSTWYATSARAWLTVARTAYLSNDETGFTQRAFDEAARCALLASDSLIPAGSAMVAGEGELSAELGRLKTDPHAGCAAAALANAEVALQVAAQSASVHGVCAAEPSREEAARWLRAAEERIAACAAQAVPPPAPVVDSVPAAVPAPLPTREELRIPNSVYFALARHDVSPASARVIDGIAELMAKYPSLRVHLVGFTDSRASAAYNLRLSRLRVEAVRVAMIVRGVEPERITVDSKGKDGLAAREDSARGFALNRRVEMQFADAEGRPIESEHQEQDLQLER